MYSLNEKVFIMKLYYSGNSTRAVSGMFAVEYPNRPIPSHTTVQRIVQKFEATGTVNDKCKCNAQENVRNHENTNADNVLQSVIENPNVSLRQVAENIGVHHTTVQKILKNHNYRSYKYQCHQELFPDDMEKRTQFCYNMMEKANEDRYFLRNVCFTDECTFTLHNEPNVQNCRIWATHNPHKYLETRTQYPQKLNVWAGILGRHIIGPFFLDGNLTSERFLQILTDEITPTLNEVAPENEEIWFQMDGCPAHNSRVVREYLQESFNNKVIGKGYEIGWPPRSPDLSPNDFFLWGHLKSKIYSGNRFENLEQLQTTIRDHCARISRHQLSNVRRQFYDRLGYCLTVNGGLFEHLL